MQSLRGSVRILRSIGGSKCFNSPEPIPLGSRSFLSATARGSSASKENTSYLSAIWRTSNDGVVPRMDCSVVPAFAKRFMTTSADSVQTPSQELPANPPARIKFKRLDKQSKHIMQILDREAVEEVKAQREIPDIKPGYIIQLKVEVPENKRRISTIKGIVIARRNAGLNTTFRLRRLVAGVGVESLFPLYSPNIKEVKVLDKKKVRRAKLYYLRDRMNPLKNK